MFGSLTGLAYQREMVGVSNNPVGGHLNPLDLAPPLPTAGAQGTQLLIPTQTQTGRPLGPQKLFDPSVPNRAGGKGSAKKGTRHVEARGLGSVQPKVKGTFWGQLDEDPARLLWSGQHPGQRSLVGGDRQGEEQDGFLAIVSPRTALAAPVFLQPHEPVLLGVLLGRVGVVVVLLQPFQEQALLTGRLRAV